MEKIIQISFEEFHQRKENISLNINDYAIQTGISFGHPLQTLTCENTKLSIENRIKYIYVEGLVLAFMKTIDSQREYQDTKSEFLKKLSLFIEQYLPKSKTGIFTLTLSEEEKVEKKIGKRALAKSDWNQHFWPGFFYNLTLTLDLFIWDEYLKTNQSNQAARINCYNYLEKAAKEVRKSISNQETVKAFQKFSETQLLPYISDNEHHTLDLAFENIPQNYSEFIAQILAMISIFTENDFSKSSEFEQFSNQTYSLKTRIKSIVFILNHWKSLNFIRTMTNYTDLAKMNLELLDQVFIKNRNTIENAIQTHPKVLELIQKSKTDSLNFTEKNEFYKLVISHLYQSEDIQIIPENVMNYTIANFTKLEIAKHLEVGINTQIGRKKSTISE
ncbi:MAG: hypothetical protein JXR34_13260 [Bacteroidales bacterium]|nr:hypothetical protein [Bacteroidales bacterium]